MLYNVYLYNKALLRDQKYFVMCDHDDVELEPGDQTMIARGPSPREHHMIHALFDCLAAFEFHVLEPVGRRIRRHLALEDLEDCLAHAG